MTLAHFSPESNQVLLVYLVQLWNGWKSQNLGWRGEWFAFRGVVLRDGVVWLQAGSGTESPSLHEALLLELDQRDLF